MAHRSIFLALTAPLLLCGGCFPSFQSPRVEPGFRVDAEVFALPGQRVGDRVGGTDYMVTVNPAYGFGRRLELGAPLGIYRDENGWKAGIMPYGKLALGDLKSPTHVAIAGQFPISIALLAGHDRGSWEPQAMLAYIFKQGSSSGDFAVDSRYAQDNQSLFALTVGASFKTSEHPAFEIGVLRNSYGITRPRVTYDPFVRAKIGLFK